MRKYTRAQIQEAICHWEKVLESMTANDLKKMSYDELKEFMKKTAAEAVGSKARDSVGWWTMPVRGELKYEYRDGMAKKTELDIKDKIDQAKKIEEKFKQYGLRTDVNKFSAGEDSNLYGPSVILLDIYDYKPHVSSGDMTRDLVYHDMSEEETAKDEVPQEDIDAFADGLAKETSQMLNEGEAEDVAMMKAKILDFIGSMKTREDIEAFMRDNKAAMEGIRRKETFPQKAKRWLSKIWDVLCIVMKFGLFCIRNITSIAILAAVIFICVKFEITPVQAIRKAYEAAKIVYQAADMTVTGAKKATDIYGSVQGKSSDIGWSVGEKVGKVIGKWL